MISEAEWILMEASLEEIKNAIDQFERYKKMHEARIDEKDDVFDQRSIELITAALLYIRDNKTLDEEEYEE